MFKYIRNPDLFHGRNKRANFFEGWYFKIVHPFEDISYAFIPGIFLSARNDSSHSFIQVIKGHESIFKYLFYDVEDFYASQSEFKLKIGKSTFSLDKMVLNIYQQNESISGTLHFKNVVKWPDSFINPGSMGFYNYLTFMQCYSQVCAIDGFVEGSLNINGREIDFTGGKIYIEKNWGRDFPNSYIWIQGNHFSRGYGALTCSIGNVPFIFNSFTGFLIAIHIKDEFYKFTTLNKSSLSIECLNERIVLKATNLNYILMVEALYKKDSFMNLLAPRENIMTPLASETISGNLLVKLYNKRTDRRIFEDTCNSAGVEFSGDYEFLTKKI